MTIYILIHMLVIFLLGRLCVCVYIYIYTIFFVRSPSLKHRDLSRAVSIQKKKKKKFLSIAAMKKKKANL